MDEDTLKKQYKQLYRQAKKRIGEARENNIVGKVIDVSYALGEEATHQILNYNAGGLAIFCNTAAADNHLMDGGKVSKEPDMHIALNGFPEFHNENAFSVIKNSGEKLFAAECHGSEWEAYIGIYSPGEWVNTLNQLHQSEDVQNYLRQKAEERQAEEEREKRRKREGLQGRNELVKKAFSLY